MNRENDHPAGLRRQNRAAVLQCLHRCGSASRKQLSAMLSLTPAAMTKDATRLSAGEAVGP